MVMPELNTGLFQMPQHASPHKLMHAVTSHLEKAVFSSASFPALQPPAHEPPLTPFPFRISTNQQDTIATLSPSAMEEHAEELGEAIGAMGDCPPIPIPCPRAVMLLQSEWARAVEGLSHDLPKAAADLAPKLTDIWAPVLSFCRVTQGLEQQPGQSQNILEQRLGPFKSSLPVGFPERVQQLMSQPRKKREYTGNKRAQKEADNEELRKQAAELVARHVEDLKDISTRWSCEVGGPLQKDCLARVDAAFQQSVQALKAVTESLAGDSALEREITAAGHTCEQCKGAYQEQWDGYWAEWQATTAKANDEAERTANKWKEADSLDVQKALLEDKDFLKRLKRSERRWDEAEPINLQTESYETAHQITAATISALVFVCQALERTAVESAQEAFREKWSQATQTRTQIQQEYSTAFTASLPLVRYVVLRALDADVRKMVGAWEASEAARLKAESDALIAAKAVEAKRAQQDKPEPTSFVEAAKSNLPNAGSRTTSDTKDAKHEPSQVTHCESREGKDTEHTPSGGGKGRHKQEQKPQPKQEPKQQQKQQQKQPHKSPTLDPSTPSFVPGGGVAQHIASIAEHLEAELAMCKARLLESERENTQLRRELGDAKAEIRKLKESVSDRTNEEKISKPAKKKPMRD